MHWIVGVFLLSATVYADWGKLWCNQDAPPQPWFTDKDDPCADPRKAECKSQEPNCVQQCRDKVSRGVEMFVEVPNLSGDCSRPDNPAPVCVGGHTGETVYGPPRNTILACTHTQRYWRCDKHGTVDGVSSWTVGVPYEKQFVCTCDPGYIGYYTDRRQCGDLTRNAVCNGHGQDANPAARRKSNQPHSEILCVCDPPVGGAQYTGQHCETWSSCPLVMGTPCGRNGKCLHPPVCTCNSGFGGATCCPAPQGVTCNGHGTCGATSLCVCAEGYGGDACCLRGCSGHGKCSIVTGKCECAAGFTGEWCETTCDPACHGGQCVVTKVNSAVRCECRKGYFGRSCEEICPSMCSAHGICVQAAGTSQSLVCICDTEFGGADCSVSLSSCQNGDRLCSGRGVCSGPRPFVAMIK